MHKVRVLIAEDEQNLREVLGMLLEGEGYDVTLATDGLVAIEWMEREIFDLIITDIKMPGAGGFEVLKRCQELSPETLVIMITAFGSLEAGVEAMKLGAYDYINKPFKIDEIRLIVKKAVERRRLGTEVTVLRESVKAACEVANILGKSEKMQALMRLIPKVAATNSNVLITGESGTGKEIVANALHSMSPREGKNFVAINCASIPETLLESELFGHMRGSFTGAVQNKEGLFEIAHGGTLFMDEVAEMPMQLQSKVLRAIENSTFRRVGGTTDITVDVRIIAATNKDLKEAIANGQFREDLFFRLNVIPLVVPPLRERQGDVPLLVEHFVKKYSDRPRQVSGRAMSLLSTCPWRGNVRELENVIERMLLFSESDILTEEDVPPEVRPEAAQVGKQGVEFGEGFSLDDHMAALEQKYLLEALSRTGGRKTDAAKLLGLTFRSFRHKLAKYGIK